MIWFQKDISLDQLERLLKGTMAEFLELKFIEIGDHTLTMSMPVNNKTIQPYGFLHGGANCVLIETVGSIASALVIDTTRQFCVGIEINANHLKSVTKGAVKGVASPLHLGRSTHVWEVKIYNDQNELTSAGRITVAIRNQKQ